MQQQRLNPSYRLSFFTLLLLCAMLISACQPIQPVAETGTASENAAAERTPSTGRLVVADTAAGGLYVYDIPSWEQVGQIDGVMMGDHAGFVALPDGRLLFTTSDTNELMVLDLNDEPTVVGQVALPGGVVHLAVDPAMTHVFVSTMKNADTGEGKTALTRIDLTTMTTTEQALVSGEPGLLVTADAVYHRDGGELGRLQAFGLTDFGSYSDESAPYVDIGAYGHGEAVVNDKIYVATDDGVDVVDVSSGELVYEMTLPWAASDREGGRAYYVRVAPSGAQLWSYLRIVANPEDDASWENWQDWQNDLYLIDLATNKMSRQDLGPGLVYRMAISDRYAFYPRLHPSGDQGILVDAQPGSATFGEIVAAVALPAVTDAPQEGIAPWDATGQRITAMTPDGAWAFITGGGDGLVHVIDTATQAIVGAIETPSSLDGGGYMVVVQPGYELVDRVGR